MAQASGYDGMPSTLSADRRTREQERQRRKAPINTEELPSFSEPIRVQVERQDSLANRIQNTLGDMETVHQLIGRDPNIWLGTSRNPSSNKSYVSEKLPARREGQPNSRTINSNSSSMGQDYTSRSKQQPSSGYNTHQSSADAVNNTHSILPSDARPHSNSISHSKSSESLQSTGSSSRSYNSRQKYNSNSSHKNTTSSPQTDTADERIMSGGLTSPANQPASNRERLQSVDMPGKMESIFREMRMDEEPLTEILPVEHVLNISRSKEKETDSAQHDINETQGVVANSDSDTSDDDDDDDDSDTDDSDQEKPTNEQPEKWNLGFYQQQMKKPDSILSVDEPPNKKSNRAESTKKTESLRETASNRSSSRGRTNERSSYKTNHGSSSDATKSRIDLNYNRGSKNDKSKDEKKSSAERFRGSNRASQNRQHSAHSPDPQSAKKSRSKLNVSGREPLNNSTHKQASSKPSQCTSNLAGEKNSEQSYSARDNQLHKKRAPSRTANPVRSNETGQTSVRNESKKSNAQNPSIPFSVSNETLPSRNPTPDKHHRTGKKGPSSILSMKSSTRVAEKKSAFSASPQHTVLSESDNSGSSDEQSSSSSAASDEDSQPVANTYNSEFRQRKSSESTSNKDYLKNDSLKRNYQQKEDLHKTSRSKNQRSAPPYTDCHKKSNNHKPVSKHQVPKTNEKNTNKQTKDRAEHSAATVTPSVQRLPTQTSKKSRQMKPPVANNKRFPSLYVRLHMDSNVPSFVNAQSDLCNATRAPSPDRQVHDEQLNQLQNHDYSDSRSSKYDKSQRHHPRRTATLSTGSETEQPTRRADSVQVAVAASSSDLSSFGSNRKRKQPSLSSYPNDQSSGIPSKLLIRETPSPICQEEMSLSTNQIQSGSDGSKLKKENNQWKNRRKRSNLTGEQSLFNNQTSNTQNKAKKATPDQYQISSRPAGVTSIISEPDSSWPEEEVLLTSHQYMLEGKRLKHEGDAYADRRTGHTRPGESLIRALVYFEASICFLMNGYMLELENGNDRGDNVGSTHSPTSMYQQTVALLDYIRKMRPHGRQEEIAFRRITLSCIRTQALLYLRMYKIKREISVTYSERITDHFKQQNPNRSSRTPSPWHNVNSQNVVSPISPAVPSPYASNMPGPSPIPGMNNSACEQVSSSTQVNKMASPQTQTNVTLPSKIYEMIRYNHIYTGYLTAAHDKWDQAESTSSDHADFFRNVEGLLSARTITMDSSLREVATYNRVILRLLRADYKSPQQDDSPRS